MKKLNVIREENAISMRDLAQKAGVSPNTIVRIESGHKVRHVTKRKIAKALKCRPIDIKW